MSDIGAPKEFREHLIDYVMSHLISFIAAAGLFLGGLIILIYLGSENYFPPDINASSIGLLFGAAAIIGIGITLAFCMYLIIPGFVYRHILAEEFKEESIDLLSDRAILRLHDVPAVAVAVWVASYIWLIIGTTSTLSLFLLIIFSIAVLVVVLFVAYGACPNTNNPEKVIRPKCWKVYAVAMASALLAAMPWLLLLLFAMGYSRNGADDSNVWIVIVGMSVLSILANHVIASAKKWWVLPLGAAALLLFIILISHQWSLIPHAVVRSLSIGDIPNATLLLDEQGCEAAMQFALDDSVADSKNRSKKCKLSSVTIVWRIGNEYWIKPQEEKDKQDKSALNFVIVDKADSVGCPEIKPAGKSGECKSTSKPEPFHFNSNIRFSLPASHVLSWSIKVPKESIEAPKESEEK